MFQIKRRKADILWSQYLRKLRNYTCERCGRKYKEGEGLYGLHVSHFYGRANEAVRFNPENTDLLCYGDHQYFTSNPNEYVTWKKKQLGEARFKALMIEANTYKKKDDTKILLALKVLLKEFKLWKH